jgi:catechol 2,3-dioxygenase-like lactoylglutathione lyase family enzyme
VTRLHHLALRTHDVDRLLSFYRDWFALELARDMRPRAVWLAIADQAVLMIEQAEEGEPPVAEHSLELLAFTVSSDRRLALRTRLIASGQLAGETEHTLYFRDPDGRRVGLSSYPL